MDSRSLKSLLEGKTRKHREAVLSGLGSWRMVYDGRYKLIRGFNPEATARDLHQAGALSKTVEPILFDLHDDPLENINLASKGSRHMDRLSHYLG
jgi:hypothetical protein